MSRIVVTGRVPDAAIEKLRLEHEVDAWPGPESISPEELLRRVAGADAILSLLTERVDGELLDAAGPQLKVVANVAVGYDNIDVAACRERGVVATNTPGTSLPHMYAQAGVRLVYVEAFPSSRLYGASFLLDDGPVIALSGLRQRLDIVLFTLLHETAHIVRGATADGYRMSSPSRR